MSVTGGQQQTFLRLLGTLRPHFRTDVHLPARVQALLSRHRAFGSRDRRLYRELIYTTVRYLPWIEPLLDRDPTKAVETIAWLAGDLPATKAFRAALPAGWPPCPPGVAQKAAILGERESDLLPSWFGEHSQAVFAAEEMDALLARAPLWLRLQTSDPEEVFAEFAARGWTWKRSETLASAVELRAESDVTATEAYRHGRFEIQDLGSQMILEAIGLELGGRWLDACAGAGGKTLQLAGLLGPAGQIVAHDIRAAALAELNLRARRAGPAIAAAITVAEQPSGQFDGVLVDAPCSGSGTWRRAPHLKWTTTAAQIEAAARRQLELLTKFSDRVRPGGRLIYATCSLSDRENQDVVTAFLAAQPDFHTVATATNFGFKPGAVGLTVLPARHDTDGFFVASLRRK